MGDGLGRRRAAARGRRPARPRAGRRVRLRRRQGRASTPARSSVARRPGSLATDDKAAILAPRRRRRAPRREQGVAAEHEHRRHRLVARVGQERHHHDLVQPPAHVRGRRRRARSAPRANGPGTRFHAAGEHPGFMFERLATSRHRAFPAGGQDHGAGVRRLLRRVGEGDARRPHGHGEAARGDHASSRRCSAPSPCSTSRRSAPPPTCSGSRSTRSATRSRPARSSHDVEVACGTLPAGTRRGSDHVVDRVPRRRPGARGRGVLDRHRRHPGMGPRRSSGPFLVRVIVDGVPPLQRRPHHRQRRGRRARGHVGRAAGGGDDRGAGHPRRPRVAARCRGCAGVRRLPLARMRCQ